MLRASNEHGQCVSNADQSVYEKSSLRILSANDVEPTLRPTSFLDEAARLCVVPEAISSLLHVIVPAAMRFLQDVRRHFDVTVERDRFRVVPKT